MSQTILIEPNEDLHKIYSINLNTFVGTDVILRKNAEEAMNLLKILPQISLIITSAQINGENTAKLLFDYIRSEDLDTSLIILGNCPELASSVPCLTPPFSWEDLIKVAAKQLGITLEQAASKPKPDYIPVGTFYFYDIDHTPCDVYIRIKKAPGEYQFVKRIHQKDIFDREIINKYELQGLKEFYIPKDYIQYFSTFVTNQLVQKLERQDLGLEERILTTSNGHDIVRDQVQNLLTIDEAIIELSDASINSMIQSVKDSPEVGNLLHFLFSNKVSYAYQHCHLLTLMCHYIFSKQSWYKPEHLKILSFVSFFSDITLKTPQQIRIGSLQDLALSNLDEEEKRMVMNHAARAAEILNGHPEFNEYTKTVLLQSHGKLNGIGFEDNPSEELHPLSKVFIVADNFVKILLNPALPSSKKEILPLLMNRFTNPSYQKIIKTLEQKF
jgi:hypothetical protein